MSSTGNTFPKAGRKPQKTGNKFHPNSHDVHRAAQLANATAAALKAEIADDTSPVKLVMDWTGASDRTVKHWLAGSHAPSGAHLVGLVQHSDKMFSAFMGLALTRPLISNRSSPCRSIASPPCRRARLPRRPSRATSPSPAISAATARAA